MLETEGVRIEFADDGLREIAAFAEDVNTRTENIGARRLHTIMEKILADISPTRPKKRGKDAGRRPGTWSPSLPMCAPMRN